MHYEKLATKKIDTTFSTKRETEIMPWYQLVPCPEVIEYEETKTSSKENVL